MSRIRHPARRLLAASLMLACAPLFAQQAHSPFSKTVFFGDSLTDSGHFRPVLVQIYGPQAAALGRFTTNPGMVWGEWLSRYYGLDATSSSAGGENFAVGGARNGEDGMTELGAVPSLASQTAAYLARNGGRADADALYTVWGGANDLFAVTAGAPAAQTIASAVGAQIGIVGQLQAAGARYVLVPNIPDLGMTPGFLAQGAAAAGQGTALSMAYNGALYQGLAAQGLQVIPLNTFGLLREVAADPARWGFANVTGTACQPQITAQSISCSPGSYVTPDAADTYAFADGVHPSNAAHVILADYALSVIEAPRQMAVLPHAAVMTGRSRMQQVGAQIDAAGEGSRWWAGLRLDQQEHEFDAHNALYDASGPALTIGFDRRAGGMVYGAYVGHGRQRGDFGGNRGDYEQTDSSVGGYFGWRSGGGWLNAQLGWTKLGFDTDRHATLGKSGQRLRGATDGRNLALALEGGWEFSSGALRHGPLLGVTAQQVRIDGFAESEPTLSTSLAYPDQRVDSLVASAGWQLRVDTGGSVQPFARLSWDRETKRDAEQAFASLQSIPEALPYAVPGLSFDRSYGTATAGARMRFGSIDVTGGASLVLGHDDGQHIGVFVNLGSGF